MMLKIIDHLEKLNKPIIFWDTCALLDLLRIDREPQNSLNFYRSIVQIKQKIDSNEITSVLVEELMFIEINNNKNKTINDYQSEIRKLNESIKHHFNLMTEILPTTESDTKPFEIKDLHSKFENIMNGIIQVSYSMDRNDAINRNAENRVFNYKNPSKNGAIKDSWILESCIEMRKIHTDYSQPCIFVSPNHTDFAAATNKKEFHSDIKVDADPLNIVYKKDINALYGYLKHNSII